MKNCTCIFYKIYRILEHWPNTYCFTKAIAENVVFKNGNHLPISVFRPSISMYFGGHSFFRDLSLKSIYHYNRKTCLNNFHENNSFYTHNTHFY